MKEKLEIIGVIILCICGVVGMIVGMNFILDNNPEFKEKWDRMISFLGDRNTCDCGGCCNDRN